MAQSSGHLPVLGTRHGLAPCAPGILKTAGVAARAGHRGKSALGCMQPFGSVFLSADTSVCDPVWEGGDGTPASSVL
eukprot:355136-Chlamydomonas_euryale.AAC.6